MYLGVDIGGTKTLVAALGDNGVIKEKVKFPTPKKYDNFLLELRHALSNLKTKDFQAGTIGVRGIVNRAEGRRVDDNWLKWGVVPMRDDIERITKCPMLLENDAKLAGLSEAMLLKKDYKRVLYITVSTGIGVALVVDGKIDTNLNDGGGQSLLLDHKGKMVAWEDFAGGHAIVERYGKKAKDINDQATWQSISRDLGKGLLQLIAITTPEVIVIGGSVGSYFDKYQKLLEAELAKYTVPLVKQPVLRQAQRPEEAVIYGCYDLAKQVYGDASTDK